MTVRASELKSLLEGCEPDHLDRGRHSAWRELRDSLTPQLRTVPWPDEAGVYRRSDGKTVFYDHMRKDCVTVFHDGIAYISNRATTQDDYTFHGPLVTIVPDVVEAGEPCLNLEGEKLVAIGFRGALHPFTAVTKDSRGCFHGWDIDQLQSGAWVAECSACFVSAGGKQISFSDEPDLAWIAEGYGCPSGVQQIELPQKTVQQLIATVAPPPGEE